MSFHPESMKGWVGGLECPYCGGDVEYIGKDVHHESGIVCAYDDVDGRCTKCGKPVRIVEEVITEVYGCYKGA